MPTEAMAVVGLPLSDVETHLWDVARWPTFLTGLVAVRRASHERYVFTVRHRRREGDVLVAVRWQAATHRFTWRALEGPPWDGSLRLAPVNQRRTRVFLQRRASPRSFLASVAEVVGIGAVDPSLDLQRLQDRLVVAPVAAQQSHRLPAPRAALEEAALDPA